MEKSDLMEEVEKKEDVKNAKAAGMNGHVAKPIDQEQLVEQLKNALRK